MQESKPILLIKKYHSILNAALIVEIVSFLVSLTDSIVAGNVLGKNGLMAVGMVAPLFTASAFVEAVINSGTVTNYSYQIGCSNKKRAYEFFSQGLVMALVSGVLFTLVLFVLKPVFLSYVESGNDLLSTYIDEYYSIIIFYFIFAPISTLLDNMVIADGGEKFSSFANVLQILANVVLSYCLSLRFGVKGIAFATVFCKAAFVILISIWFFLKNNTIRFVRHYSFQDGSIIVRRGIVRATTFILTAVMMAVLNAYVYKRYRYTVFEVWIVVQRVLGLSSMFMGLAMTLQPVVTTLMGEKNTKALRILAGRSSIDMMAAGVLLTIFIMIFTPFTLRVFGIEKGDAAYPLGITALRITGLTLLVMSIMVFLFVYYFLIDKQRLAFIVTVLKDLVCPLFLVYVLGFLWKGNHLAIWTGLNIAPLLALAVILLIVWVIYDSKQFPFLIPDDENTHIHIYVFPVDTENVVDMSKTAFDLLQEEGFSKRIQTLISLCLEELLLLIKEKNVSPKKPLMAEVTLITDKEGVRLIIRDTGEIFEITDEDAEVDSFRQYFVANMITLSEYKIYLKTIGINRNELYFKA